jgi:hypothetical protein
MGAAFTSLSMLEFYGLRTGQIETISSMVWWARQNKVANLGLIMFWCWVTYHFFFEEH